MAAWQRLDQRRRRLRRREARLGEAANPALAEVRTLPPRRAGEVLRMDPDGSRAAAVERELAAETRE